MAFLSKYVNQAKMFLLLLQSTPPSQISQGGPGPSIVTIFYPDEYSQHWQTADGQPNQNTAEREKNVFFLK